MFINTPQPGQIVWYPKRGPAGWQRDPTAAFAIESQSYNKRQRQLQLQQQRLLRNKKFNQLARRHIKGKNNHNDFEQTKACCAALSHHSHLQQRSLPQQRTMDEHSYGWHYGGVAPDGADEYSDDTEVLKLVDDLFPGYTGYIGNKDQATSEHVSGWPTDQTQQDHNKESPSDPNFQWPSLFPGYDHIPSPDASQQYPSQQWGMTGSYSQPSQQPNSNQVSFPLHQGLQVPWDTPNPLPVFGEVPAYQSSVSPGSFSSVSSMGSDAMNIDTMPGNPLPLAGTTAAAPTSQAQAGGASTSFSLSFTDENPDKEITGGWARRNQTTISPSQLRIIPSPAPPFSSTESVHSNSSILPSNSSDEFGSFFEQQHRLPSCPPATKRTVPKADRKELPNRPKSRFHQQLPQHSSPPIPSSSINRDATASTQSVSHPSGQQRSKVSRSSSSSELKPKPETAPTVAFTTQNAQVLDEHVAERLERDEMLLKWKGEGLTYREIRKKGRFPEAESTLRGRYRTLTKSKEARVRKPEWTEKDVRLLKEAVRRLKQVKGSDPSAAKIPWKQVADYIVNNDGTYLFGNATCRKKWDELIAEGKVS